MSRRFSCFIVFRAAPTTDISTLSLHDALPIYTRRALVEARLLSSRPPAVVAELVCLPVDSRRPTRQERKSTRLNSSHTVITYAVFCLKKKSDSIEYFIRIVM